MKPLFRFFFYVCGLSVLSLTLIGNTGAKTLKNLTPQKPVEHPVTWKAYRSNESGIRALNAHRLEDAMTFFSESLSEAPHSGEVRVNIGHLLSEMQDLNRARAFYEQAKEYLPASKHAELYYHLGNVFAMSGEYDMAKTAYLQSMIRNPNDLDTKWNYEWVLAQESQQKSGKKPIPKQLEKDQEALEKQRKEAQQALEQQFHQHVQLLKAVEAVEKQAQEERLRQREQKETFKNDW